MFLVFSWCSLYNPNRKRISRLKFIEMIFLNVFLMTLAVGYVASAPTFFDNYYQPNGRTFELSANDMNDWNTICRYLQRLYIKCYVQEDDLENSGQYPNVNPQFTNNHHQFHHTQHRPDFHNNFNGNPYDQRPIVTTHTKSGTTTEFPGNKFHPVTDSIHVPAGTTKKTHFIPPFITPKPDPSYLKPEFHFNVDDKPKSFATEQDDMNGFPAEELDYEDEYGNRNEGWNY